jgi:hypothetical protein
MNENTTEKPMTATRHFTFAEIVSVTLTAQEVEQLKQTGSVQASNSNEAFELPQGPAFFNGQWHC